MCGYVVDDLGPGCDQTVSIGFLHCRSASSPTPVHGSRGVEPLAASPRRDRIVSRRDESTPLSTGCAVTVVGENQSQQLCSRLPRSHRTLTTPRMWSNLQSTAFRRVAASVATMSVIV